VEKVRPGHAFAQPDLTVGDGQPRARRPVPSSHDSVLPSEAIDPDLVAAVEALAVAATPTAATPVSSTPRIN
jgi:hypothetical protein